MENRLTVGLAHGDVNGIGYELIIKMMTENKICDLCTPILFGSSKAAAYHRKALNIEGFALNSIQKPEEANAKRCNVINVTDDAVKVDLGRETRESDESAMLALRMALDSLDAGQICALAAAPQGFASFPKGYLAYFAERYRVQQMMPLFVGEHLRIGFVTLHVPFREAAGAVTAERVYNKLVLLNDCLKTDFTIRKPRIAVLGLNPHAGEGGICGEEEKNALVPAITKARDAGIMALGPYSVEALFSTRAYEGFDAILAMYHDQGALPFRLIERNGGAVYFAGLPVVYTTTIHGMAYDIVGKGVADDTGMRKALYLGMDVYRNRKMNANLKKNPLKHYSIASNGNEGDLNVEQIAGVEKEKEV